MATTQIMGDRPKKCVNSMCKNIMYVPEYKLHMCLQCEACTNKAVIELAEPEVIEL